MDIVMDDRKVSREHAIVERIGARTVLTDTGSTNGTWLNGKRLTGTAELRDGDRIRVGQVELVFFDPGAAPTEPVGTIRYRPVPAPAPPAPRAITVDSVPVSPAPCGPVPFSPAGPVSPTPDGQAPDGPEEDSGLEAVLGEPTQPMSPERRGVGRFLVLVGGCAVVIGWALWAFLVG